MGYRPKPKSLKRKNIKRKTGARAQSKQILQLSKSLTKLNKSQYESVATVWNRENVGIDTLTGGVNAYICPIPISMCNVYSQNTVITEGDADQRIKWSDNLGIAAQPSFQKSELFGSSEAARDSPEVTHTGTYINYRMICSEPSFSTYSVFLLRARKRHSDQLISDRQLKNGTINGRDGALRQGVDYITHPDVMGTEINQKYWDVLYHREVNFGHPGSTSQNRTASANNASPLNNAIIATGRMKVPGGTVIRNQNITPYEDASNPVFGFKKASASQIGFVDEPNHSTAYIVIVNNGSSADADVVSLSLLVHDYYKAAV